MIETLSVPFWRLLADDCLVIFNTDYKHIDTAMNLIRVWGLRYVTTVPYHSKWSKVPCIIASKGQAELLWDVSSDTELPPQGGVFDLTLTWGNPRLAINVKQLNHLSALAGWSLCAPTGSKGIDPYYYPLRKNGYNVDQSLNDVFHAIRHERQNVRSSEWKILEKFAIMLVNSRLSKKRDG